VVNWQELSVDIRHHRKCLELQRTLYSIELRCVLTIISWALGFCS